MLVITLELGVEQRYLQYTELKLMLTIRDLPLLTVLHAVLSSFRVYLIFLNWYGRNETSNVQ